MEIVSKNYEEYINQLLKMNPTSFKYKQLKANLLMKAQRWGEAIKLYDELIRKPAGKVELTDKFNQAAKKSKNNE